MPNRRPLPDPRPALPDKKPAAPAAQHGWMHALALMCTVGALLWMIQIANAADDYGFDRFGLKPREVDGLWGIVTMPFLHASYPHLLSNTVPLVVLGWVVLLAGPRIWGLVTGTVVLLGDLLTWLVGPGHTVIVGASGLVFGWLGYLLARAYFTRRLKWIFIAVIVLIFFGSLLAGLLPTITSDVAWQAHVCGFAAGIIAGAALHPRPAAARRPRRSVVS